MQIKDLLPATKDLAITLPDGSPTGIVFKIKSVDNPAFHKKARQNAMHMREAGQKADLHVVADQAAELAATCIAGWTGLEEDGEPVPFSYEKAVELMKMPELTFVREQVEAFATVRANFFRAGAEAA